MGQGHMDIKQIMNKRIGIIDANNFYVSCERLFNPRALSRPSVVLSNNDGYVIARSQEAKDMGIRMGEVFFQKREFMERNEFCVFSSNYNLYGDMSDRFMSVIARHVNEVEIYSIDECFIDITDYDSSITNKLHFIRDEVKRLTGIPVSIGVGPNKTLAKLTSKVAKQMSSYNGVCSYWDIDDIDAKIFSLQVDDIWGIGRQWAKKLKSLGIRTIGQFMSMDDIVIKKMLNVSGVRTKMELMGVYCHKVTPYPKQKKHIASTKSFADDINDLNQISEAMYTYITSGIKKLKDSKLAPNKATIFIRGNKHKGEEHCFSRRITFQRQTRDINEIWAQVQPHLKDLFNANKTYKKCGIIFSNLYPENIEQSRLFVEDYRTIEAPDNAEKKWHMRQDFLSKKYTTQWDDIPCIK